MQRLPNPRSSKQHKVTKLNAVIRKATCSEEEFQELRTDNCMRDQVGVEAAPKAARMVLFAKAREGAPVIANYPKVRKGRRKSQCGM